MEIWVLFPLIFVEKYKIQVLQKNIPGSSKDLHTYMLKEQRKHTAVKGFPRKGMGQISFPLARGEKQQFTLSLFCFFFFLKIKEAFYSLITHFVELFFDIRNFAVLTGGSRVGIGEPALTGLQGRCQKYRPILVVHFRFPS